MGFYTTASECECRGKTQVSAAKLSGEDAPPSKNRVVVFQEPSPICTQQFTSQVLDLHRENRSIPTIIVSGVRYYGHRYLHTELGCWMSRDPIGERGGLNIYLMVVNAPIYRFDLLGLTSPWLSVSHSISMGNCGKFSWDDTFKLNAQGSLTGSGTIIQNMSIDIHVWDCAGNDITAHIFGGPVQDMYAETWSIGSVDSWAINGEALDETASPCGTRGKGIWKGAAQYFDSYVASDLNDPWGLLFPWSYSGPKAPQPWGTTLGMTGWLTETPDAPSAQGFRRKLIVEWDCCGQQSPTTYSYAGISSTAMTP